MPWDGDHAELVSRIISARLDKHRHERALTISPDRTIKKGRSSLRSYLSFTLAMKFPGIEDEADRV